MISHHIEVLGLAMVVVVDHHQVVVAEIDPQWEEMVLVDQGGEIEKIAIRVVGVADPLVEGEIHSTVIRDMIMTDEMVIETDFSHEVHLEIMDILMTDHQEGTEWEIEGTAFLEDPEGIRLSIY